MEKDCAPIERLPDDALEELARSTHEGYLEDRRREGTLDPLLPTHRSWDQLPPDVQGQNRSQIRAIVDHLHAVELSVVPAGCEDGRRVVDELDDEQVERMARLEHDRWVEWTLDTRPNHPDAVHWDRLSEAERQKDREPMRRVPSLLGSVGYVVVEPLRD